MKLKRKLFNYSETSLGGINYYPGQVVSDLVINPLDKGVDYIDKSRLGKIPNIKRKTRNIKSILVPIKKLLKKKSDSSKKN